MVIYIDIDGTLIMTSERHLQSGAYETGLGCLEFLRYATNNFECRWLTFHARRGYINNVSRVFREALRVHTLPDDWRAILDKIQPAPWSATKTDGIDFTRDFAWIDDDVSLYDQNILASKNMTDRWIKAHLNHFPPDLFRIKEILEERRVVTP